MITSHCEREVHFGFGELKVIWKLRYELVQLIQNWHHDMRLKDILIKKLIEDFEYEIRAWYFEATIVLDGVDWKFEFGDDH